MENISKSIGRNGGQVTIVDMFAFLVAIFIWAVLAPLINTATLPVVAYFQANPNPISPAIIILIQLISFVLVLSLILTIINKAAPSRERYGP